MGMSFVTLFFFMISGWFAEPAGVAAALAPFGSPFWFGATLFCVSFYVVSPLLAFNVFTAFSIDVYNQIVETKQKNIESGYEGDEVEKNLGNIKAKYADKGQ